MASSLRAMQAEQRGGNRGSDNRDGARARRTLSGPADRVGLAGWCPGRAWTPAHIETAGNEIADLAAKEATRLPPSLSALISLTTCKRRVREIIVAKWDALWKLSTTGRALRLIDRSPPSLTRQLPDTALCPSHHDLYWLAPAHELLIPQCYAEPPTPTPHTAQIYLAVSTFPPSSRTPNFSRHSSHSFPLRAASPDFVSFPSLLPYILA
ncbi:hypothetical protein B0H19DRAFT_1255429 [Mycena capillaripes]|nr:hypothetical protein B0H19DRAFT_1255429 [Mycena capillaripes]